MMRIGICDGDKSWRMRAEELILQYGKTSGIEMETFRFAGGKQLESYTGEPMDVLFIDVVLNDASGISTAVEINRKWKKCQIVYLTNYLFFATEVYHTDHVFYVLKAQFADRIGEIFEKIFDRLSRIGEKLIFSVIGGEKLSAAPEDILYFERKGRETGIHTCWGVYAVWDKLQTLMERLPILDFVRCHNSYIVNLLSVREMRDNEFIMTEGSSVPISRRYAKTVKEAFVRLAGTQIS